MKQKKSFKTFAIAIALLIGSLPMWGQSFSGSGSGTESDPYLIYNPNHLNDVHNFIGQSGVVFKLMANIDLSSWLAENNPTNGWLPIGTEAQPFKGKFLGNNKTISGLFINRSTSNDVGFFGYADGATISYLTINGTTVKGANHTGGLCGIAFNSTITSCKVSISVTGTGDVGGFTGNIDECVIKNSNNNGNVNGATSVAGFSGYARKSTLTDITINSNVTATGDRSGQCAGYIGSGTTNLTNIKAVGTINGATQVGGIVGRLKSGGVITISNSSVNGNITGSSYIGGIVGISEADKLTVTNSFHKGTIDALEYIGGIVGSVTQKYLVQGCGHSGAISGQQYVGGCIGQVKLNYAGTSGYTTDLNATITESNTLTNCFSNGDILGKGGNYLGGIVGMLDAPNVSRDSLYYQVDMSDQIVCDVAGGATATPTSSNAYYYAYRFYYNNNLYYLYTKKKANEDAFINTFVNAFNAQLNQNTGYKIPSVESHIINLGMIQSNYVVTSKPRVAELLNSYYSGDINGSNYVGGIIGYGDYFNLNTSYSSGNINGKEYVGGVIGYAKSKYSDNNSSISSCVSANEVIVGTNGNTGRIYGSIGDNVTIGATGTTSANKGLATAKVTSAGSTVTLDDGPQHGTNVGASTLRLKSNYVGMSWDFDNYWKIQETECYPYKASQCAPPKITSQLIAGATSVSGQSIDGGTVVLFTGNGSYTAAVSSNKWTVNVPEGLQSGDIIKVCATKTGLMQSYFTTGTVGFAGSGTENDPYLIYTANDLASINSYSYYKIMNNINVSSWISSNSPTTGWVPIGMNSGVSMKQLDGNGKTISGLWTNSTTNNYGLISTANDATIKNLTINVASGKQVKGGSQTGVVVGLASGTTFENITINGKCTGTASVAGVAGKGTNCIFNNCSVISTLTGTDNVGGLVGWSSGSTLSNCSSNITINGTKYLGGIAGYSESNSYTNCNSSGNIKSTTNYGYVGGIIGKAQTTTNTINKCFSKANVTGITYVGGLVGNGVKKITESYSAGTVTGTKTDDCLAGGLTGLNEGTIQNCYSTATVISGQYGAGITGINYGTIDRCYASGNVSAQKWGAGITAYNDGSGAKVTHCFAANNKIQVSESGGIGMRMIGGFRNGASEPNNTNYALNSMVVSVNNVTKIIYDDPLEGISITQAQLYAQSTYVNNGWDFNETWGIDEGNGYPYLLALVEEETPEFTPGDVNDDGAIDVADYVDVASYILEQDPQPFNFAAADLDEDNAIDVGDLVGVAYLALNYEGTPMLASTINTPEAASIAMDATVSSTASEKYEVSINLSNNIAITAMQMDINLPEDMTLVDASLSDRASASHKLAFNQLANGDYRLLAASSTLKSFKSNDGVVLTFTLSGTPDGNGRLSGIKLATPAATRYSIDDIELNFTPTGIENLTTAARIYSEGNNIVIVSPSDGMAQIVLPNGMNKTVKVATGHNVVETPAKGLVIVKMGNEAKKLRF